MEYIRCHDACLVAILMTGWVSSCGKPCAVPPVGVSDEGSPMGGSVQSAPRSALKVSLVPDSLSYAVRISFTNEWGLSLWINMRMVVGSRDDRNSEIWLEVFDVDRGVAISEYTCKSRFAFVGVEDYILLPPGATYSMPVPIYCQAPVEAARLRVTAHYRDETSSVFEAPRGARVYPWEVASNPLEFDYAPPWKLPEE